MKQKCECGSENLIKRTTVTKSYSVTSNYNQINISSEIRALNASEILSVELQSLGAQTGDAWGATIKPQFDYSSNSYIYWLTSNGAISGTLQVNVLYIE